MRKPSSDPAKPAKIRGKDFHIGRKGYWRDIRRIDHPLLKGKFEGDWEIENARQELECRKGKFRYHVWRNEWEQCLDMLQPRERLSYLLSLRRHIGDDEELLQLLRHVLAQNPTLHAYEFALHQFYRRMGSRTPWSEMMTEAEIERFRCMPARVALWQGSGNPGLGWAWTPDRELALGYARSHAEHSLRQQGYLFQGQVPKTSIVGILLDTPPGHETIFANPDRIQVMDGAIVGKGA